MVRDLMLAAALALGSATTGQAQVAARTGLTLDGATRAITAAVAEARRLSAPGAVVAIVDDGGNLMALERLDGTFAAGAQISIGKARTAVLFKRPTKAFEDIIKNGRTAMVALPDAFFTPLQGGVPIVVDGTVVGGIGVSGAASADQDEQLALAGANALASAHPSTTAPASDVRYFDRAAVEASFAKGAVLFDASDKYMVHTSRRERPGQAEVHQRDADIIYVTSGTATLVTGGTVVDGQATAPDEIRGRAIDGGTPRSLNTGDVLVVPAGTPHWFRDVPGPFTYYVVKAR
jgi:glc operon protein GlcG